MNKKCVFPKMGTKKLSRNRKTRVTQKEVKDRKRRLKEWRKWWS